MKYRTKPFEIEAVLFTGENFKDIQWFVGSRASGQFKDGKECFINNFQRAGTYVAWDDQGIVAEVYDKLHSTWVGVKVGQYIIRGMKDEFYPCDADVFETKYEPAFANGGRIDKPLYMSPNREIVMYSDGRLECARLELTNDNEE